MKITLWALAILLTSPIIFTQCSSDDGVSCGGLTCGSDEVCESGACVPALNIVGETDQGTCLTDSDCPSTRICTLADSEPAHTCIPRLDCDRDSDCQTGLKCDNQDTCR